MPVQHRRTYSAIYEMALAGAFTVVPFIAYLLADNPGAFRLLALPGGLAVTVVPVLVYLVLPESPRCLRRLRTEFVGVLREYSGKGLYRLPDGNHRATVEDCVRARRIASWALYDADGAPYGRLCDGCDGRGRIDHRLYRAIRLHRGARLPLRTVPDGAARPWAHFRRVVFTAFRWRPGAIPDGTAHTLADNLLRYHLVVVAIGAFIPLLFGRETVGQLEAVTERVRAFA